MATNIRTWGRNVQDAINKSAAIDFLTGPVARVLYAVPFGIFGFNSLFRANASVVAVPNWVPGGVFWVYIAGAALIATSVAILSKRMLQPAALILAGLMAVFIATVHLPALVSSTLVMGALLRDTALMSGALLLARRQSS